MASKQHPPYFATFITLVAVFTMCWLGYWQMQRAEEKNQRLDQINERQRDAAIDLELLKALEQDKRDISFVATGIINSAQYFLLDNRLEAGQVGYHVLVPLDTDQGILLVNFGWVKAGLRREVLPIIQLPQGFVELSGKSQIPSFNPMVSETAKEGDAWPIVVQAIDLAKLSSLLGQSLLPIVMQLDQNDPHGFVRNWQAVVMAPEKHYAYAVQWFGLAIACILIYLFALRKRKAQTYD